MTKPSEGAMKAAVMLQRHYSLYSAASQWAEEINRCMEPEIQAARDAAFEECAKLCESKTGKGSLELAAAIRKAKEAHNATRS